MLAFVALTLIGAQVVQLGVFARTYALMHIGERDALLERLRGRIRLEHGLLVRSALVLASASGSSWSRPLGACRLRRARRRIPDRACS